MKTVSVNMATRRRLQKFLWECSDAYYIFRSRSCDLIESDLEKSTWTRPEYEDQRNWINSASKKELLARVKLVAWWFLYGEHYLTGNCGVMNLFVRHGLTIDDGFVSEADSWLWDEDLRFAVHSSWANH